MDKSWMGNPNRRHPEYIKGVHDFMKFAVQHMQPGETTIRCPCKKCNNINKMTPDYVEEHIYTWGVVVGYSRWIYHGENFVHENEDNSNNVAVEDQHGPHDDMEDILNDIRTEILGRDNDFEEDDFEEDDFETQPDEIHGNSFEKNDDKFTTLMRDAEQEAYPSCLNFTKLSCIVKLLHIKLISKWTNTSFDMLLKFLKELFPQLNIPSTHREAKKIIRDLGLGYNKIHVCKNDCVLFWKENKLADTCPTCKAPRYKSHKGKGNPVPHKVLRHFPLFPRLRRLFSSRKVAKEMRWHKETRVEENGILRHPADSKEWKDFDHQHQTFSRDPRNLRFGLSSDGFNPFSNMSTTYSVWPVILVIYNLPPWKGMKDTFFIMSLLIPGPRAPGIDIDVYLAPLIDELKVLWDNGIKVFDVSKEEYFTLRGALLWTINDFPAYANLSGWSTKGKLACPPCNEDASHEYLRHGKKICYMGHSRFAPVGHRLRKSHNTFNRKVERRPPPKMLSGEEVVQQLENVNQPIFGKHDQRGKKRKRSPTYLNWSKRSIFFELSYWKTLKLRHNLDVMHIEKNICESIIGTLMDIQGKSKDSDKARLDMEALGIKPELHLLRVGDDTFIPPACYTMSPNDKREFCEFLSSVKFPDGYASNISHCVSPTDCKLTGLKTHDYHVLLQRLVPVALRGYSRKDVGNAIIQLGLFFKELTSKTLHVDVLYRLKKDIICILCKLENIFPPAFFDVMIHLSVHLVDEALLGGPVQCRWMYPFESYMKTLKGYVRNKAHPEGSIAEGYIDTECMTFCSMYFEDIETRFNRRERNDEREQLNEDSGGLSIFSQKARGIGAPNFKVFDSTDLGRAHLYILNNCDEVYPYLEEHKEELRKQGSVNLEKRHESEFPDWFLKRVNRQLEEGNEGITSQLLNLARGPDPRVTFYSGCTINGIRFLTKERETNRSTQNSGVVVKGFHKGKSVEFYGYIRDVIELHYLGMNRVFLFKCDWWDVGSAAGIYVDENDFLSVNTTKTWYKDEPFVLASQAEQVFYLNDTRRGQNWRVVQKITPRSTYDIPEKEGEEEEEEDALQEEESFGLFNNPDTDDLQLPMNRTDMDLLQADVGSIQENQNVGEIRDLNEEENEDSNEGDGFTNDEDVYAQEEEDEDSITGYDSEEEHI